MLSQAAGPNTLHVVQRSSWVLQGVVAVLGLTLPCQLSTTHDAELLRVVLLPSSWDTAIRMHEYTAQTAAWKQHECGCTLPEQQVMQTPARHAAWVSDQL